MTTRKKEETVVIEFPGMKINILKDDVESVLGDLVYEVLMEDLQKRDLKGEIRALVKKEVDKLLKNPKWEKLVTEAFEEKVRSLI